ncbi:MAG: type 1 periplasmic binding fold superfamily protein [Flavobacteriaceae bacterium]|nr:type 1 periplasmic binding fold superfamily protein [Flavobacteriaceae bacterium]|tara:strand:- start:25537 stop:26073 length:537 start_codon:yes stop_codon:yes gene_type:complete
MKIFKYALLAIPFLYFSCSDDDDNSIPEPINEEEVITTMNVYVNEILAMSSTDPDGDGPLEPVVTDGVLAASTTYDVRLEFLNELEDPAEDITEEVEEESLAHQVFYSVGGDLNVGVEYANFDTDGNPLGTQITLTTNEAGSGTITITLIHEPMKPNDGLATAGGETDMEVTFNVSVE